MDIMLGMRASDRLSPFKGVVFGVGRYFDGSVRVQLACHKIEGGEAVMPWFDVGQLELKAPLTTDPWDTIPLPEGEHPGMGDLVRSVIDEQLEGPVVARYDYLYGCNNLRVMVGRTDAGAPNTYEDGLSAWKLIEADYISPMHHIQDVKGDDGEDVREGDEPALSTGGPRQVSDGHTSDSNFRS